MDELADTRASVSRRLDLPRLAIADGTLESVKWLALLLMTLDHVNKYLLHGALPVLFALGRISLPLFAFVLAYNLARPLALAQGTHKRIAGRLLLFGALATPPFIALGGLGAGWWPLNIMATLLVATGIMYLLERPRFFTVVLALILFLISGALVEYWWPAIALTVAAWHYLRRPGWLALLVWLLATLALNLNGWAFAGMPLVNASLWAFAAVPLIVVASRLRLNVPRLRRVFYLYYPLHLAGLWVVREFF